MVGVGLGVRDGVEVKLLVTEFVKLVLDLVFDIVFVIVLDLVFDIVFVIVFDFDNEVVEEPNVNVTVWLIEYNSL